MSRMLRLAVLGLVGSLAMAPAAHAQRRGGLSIGFVYPAGGQQGTTFLARLGGQALDGVDQVVVSGTGVRVKVIDYFRKMGPQEMGLLNQQLREFKRGLKGTVLASVTAPTTTSDGMMMDADGQKKAAGGGLVSLPASGAELTPQQIMARIEKRVAEYVNRPACASISSLAFVEVTIDPDAAPGPREIRLATPRGMSNPLAFYVGQVPEVARKPMLTAQYQVLGKEWLAQRKRPADEVEVRVTLPCTANGQIASGEVNRYRFEARKGQRLVISTTARQSIPYIADAVPGWFQPVLTLYDAAGQEVAYNDDYLFHPDPLLLFEVPQDGEYVLAITDAIYRGREDFVYRVTMGELPLVTSIFPLGARAGDAAKIQMKGWNLRGAELVSPGSSAAPGVHPVWAMKDKFVSNRVPFAVDTLPECLEKEPNNDPAHAQKVELPIVVNGRIDRPDDWDVFQFTGRAGETIVAEVHARRLGSPLDSMLKLTDVSGKLLAFNDDHEDLEAGANTHDADSYLTFNLPADGTYYVHVGDTSRHGGEEYAYRLRISGLRPDFALMIVPSSVMVRSKGIGTVNVYAIRKEGFNAPIKLSLKDPPAGFTSIEGVVRPDQPVGRMTVKAGEVETLRAVGLHIEGRATVDGRELVHEAVPAEDRMQAFLWRHLLPAQELGVLVSNPAYNPSHKRVSHIAATSSTPEAKPAEKPAAKAAERPAEKPAVASAAGSPPAKPGFTKQQAAGRLRQLKTLFDDWLLTDEFYEKKVAECEAMR